ncbi:MAG: cytochrome c oxidase accessory protein CcoG [Hydrotalea sp.]|nr:cytochrome c oxidase accessory protein CcoG [Hydrotalea sp.]
MISNFEHVNEPSTEEFRDRVATIDQEGKRKWIYAYQPKGRFYNIRTLLSILYFVVFFGLPFIKIDGRPLFMFNIPEAKFILFSKVFWPQDFFIFGLTMITFVIFIILFTAAFGRLFCGWACPQTNFMEMMFRKVEYWIEGDAGAQRQLNLAPWDGKKIRKKVLKHGLFYALSFVISNFFLAYIIGIDELTKIITEPVTQHITGFTSIIVFSGVFYAVFAFFREQACTVVCPYGRLQGVLLDKNSMIVAYDYVRGEPRGNAKKVADPTSLGDCIDCHQCVKVCPTGIDIRDGVQLECVGCTACIDACDNIMDKIGKPRGLIRYASENSIATGVPLKYTTRMKLYTGLLGLLLVILGFLLMSRKDVDATVMRAPGILYQERGADSVSNLFNIKMVNKTTSAIPLSIRVKGGDGKVEIIGKNTIDVKKEGQGAGSFFVVLPKSRIQSRKTTIELELMQGNQLIAVKETNFLGPVE